MAIALVNHFEVSPAGAAERPATSPEARFVGLAAWLAARVVACTPLASPPVRSSGEPAAAPSECSDDADALDSHMRFLSGMHGLLGERGLCTAAGGAFLKHVFLVCQQQLERGSDSPAHWDVAGSCLRCMFDIKLHSSSGSTAERHPSVRVDMDQQLANAAYLLVEPELLDALRSRKGAGLRSDLKAVVDKADSVLGGVDIAKHPRLAMNMDAIDDYLDGATMPTFAQLEHALRGDGPRAVHVACVPLRGTADSMGIPAACLSLPFVRATMQHDLLLSRMRSGLARAVEDYDETIEDYKLNVSLSPASAEAWHHLGQAHSDLADELLLGTASEVLDSRHDIATLLRSALSCVLQAKQLLEPIGQPSVRRSKQFSGRDDDGDSTGSSEALGQLHGQVYSLAGWLLYRIAARPLPMLALEILPSNILVADDDDDGDDDSDADHDNDDVDHGDEGRGSRQAWDVGAWGSSGAHAEALSRSLGRRYSVAPPCSRVYALAHEMLLHATRLEPGSWKPVYMLGKATGKLGRPLAACALYLKACHLACAAAPAPLSAYSMPGGAADAMCKLLSTLVKLVCGPPETPHPAAASLFAATRDVLDQVCAADKRRRHHRSAFLLAWMSHHVFSDPERAKHALLGLLQMRGAGKQLASFYKTDFEAAGKHYLYLEKYLALYIDTLAATRDIDGIRALARKLPRSADMLYDAPAMLRRVGTAEMAILQSMVRALSCPR
ncbi:Histone transcription regulator 3, partial [Coemansia nantahalensis]